MGGARARENQVPLLRSRVVSLVSARTLVVCTLHLVRSIRFLLPTSYFLPSYFLPSYMYMLLPSYLYR